MDYSIKIGGEAGQGIQTIGDSLAKIFSRYGYHVFTSQDYESRIRGGHNFYLIRLSDQKVQAIRERIDILVALDAESIEQHGRELVDHGFALYDGETLKHTESDERFLDIPLVRLARQEGGNPIMANTVAIGAVLGMMRFPVDAMGQTLEKTFQHLGAEVVASNLKVAQAGYQFAQSHCPLCSFVPAPSATGRLLIDGASAIGLGAIASGLKFYTAYPMTPSTGVMTYIASHAKELGIMVEQAEDEISAINMVIGASFAGVRAMTCSSGGGFALMVEGLSLAAMTETPVVIGLGMRPGPATGFPTRTEQGDLLFALHAGHGEFPRVLFAPGTPEQAFYLTNKAFDLAEKYQVPALILFDQYLADSLVTCERLDFSKLYPPDSRLRGDTIAESGTYRRYAFTPSGVSPLAVPGNGLSLVVADSDEHDQDGHITEDGQTRIQMTDKRLLRKLPLLRQEISPPKLLGDPTADVVLVGWGSTYGPLTEAVREFAGRSVALLHFSQLSPFPGTETLDYLGLLRQAKSTICVENNATGQFARLLQAETGFRCHHQIHRYDGRPFTVDGLVGEINGVLGSI
jgi:2-oxoglutarate ferredoxin oxidoreductase subunit alpha